jgi:hypothetical protein
MSLRVIRNHPLDFAAHPSADCFDCATRPVIIWADILKKRQDVFGAFRRSKRKQMMAVLG